MKNIMTKAMSMKYDWGKVREKNMREEVSVVKYLGLLWWL